MELGLWRAVFVTPTIGEGGSDIPQKNSGQKPPQWRGKLQQKDSDALYGPVSDPEVCWYKENGTGLEESGFEGD